LGSLISFVGVLLFLFVIKEAFVTFETFAKFIRLEFNYLNFVVLEVYNSHPLVSMIKGMPLNNFNFPEMIRVYVFNKEKKKEKSKNNVRLVNF